VLEAFLHIDATDTMSYSKKSHDFLKNNICLIYKDLSSMLNKLRLNTWIRAV
jgi:hypothetical protein